MKMSSVASGLVRPSPPPLLTPPVNPGTISLMSRGATSISAYDEYLFSCRYE